MMGIQSAPQSRWHQLAASAEELVESGSALGCAEATPRYDVHQILRGPREAHHYHHR